MLYILTVHWKSDKWIEIQNQYLTNFVPVPYKTIGILSGIDSAYDHYFDEVIRMDIRSHAKKLDFVANHICEKAETGDLLLFIDGDAFPINTLSSTLEKLKTYELVAIQRLENNGDLQPHPSFCLTTIDFWRKYKPTWALGYKWKDSLGRRVTDIGGELLKLLEENNIEWYRMNRSNKNDIAPLSFGIYENIIYHHSFGFRDGFGGRVSLTNENLEILHFHFITKHLTRLKNKRLIALRNLLIPFFKRRDELFEQTKLKNEEVFAKIKSDREFYESLM